MLSNPEQNGGKIHKLQWKLRAKKIMQDQDGFHTDQLHVYNCWNQKN